MTQERILHALDLAILGDWEGAKQSLESADDPVATRLVTLITNQQESESVRTRERAMMRHEIGNALSSAQVNVAGMADGMLDVTQARLNGIRDALQTAGYLLGEQKKQSAEPLPQTRSEVFDICELIAAQVSMLTGLAEAKHVQVRYRPCGLHHEACIKYRGDAVRTGQVLRNVLLNAVRYTPPGGTIDVHCYRPDNELTFTVSDSGPGIDHTDLPHVFEHGYRGAGAAGTPGHGIGLSVVSKLLKALGGEARILSETEKGATFIIKLPAPAAPAQH